MSGNLGLGGLMSGFNTESLIQKILERDSMRLVVEQRKKALVQGKQKSWASVKASLESLRSKLDAIRLSSLFTSRSATLSDSTVASVTASSGAALSTHSLTVRALAQSHVVAGSNQTSPNTALGASGTLVVNGKSISLSATDTLNSVRDKINTTSDINATADVVKVMSGATEYYRLVVTSKASGTAGAITMSSALVSSNLAVVDPAGSTAAGGWDVGVSALAQAEVVRSDFVGDVLPYVGTFDITKGDGTVTQIDCTAGATASQVAQKINDANIGITATTETDLSGNVRVTLTANQTGLVNSFSFTADPNNILSDMGLIVGGTPKDFTPKHQVTDAQDAAYTIDGVAYTSASNQVTNAGGVTGLSLSLTGTGSARVEGLAQKLGFKDDADAYANQLSAAQNADFTLNGVDYSTATNEITSVLPNVTFSLKKAGTTTITIGQDVETVEKAISAWVSGLNGSMDLLQRQMKYDSEKRISAPLAGDSLARTIERTLRGSVGSTVAGLPSTLDELSEIGITTGAWGTVDYGKVTVDSAKLRQKLTADPEGVARLFGAMQTNVALATEGATAAATSTAAGFAAADVTNGDTDSDRFGSAGGGWQSAVAPSAGSPQTLTVTFGGTKSIDQIQLFIPDNATYDAEVSGLKDYKLQYQGADDLWYDLQTVTNHTGSTKTFDFNPVQAKAVRLEVTATYGTDNPARVTELKVHQLNSGVATSQYRNVSSWLSLGGGAVDTRSTALTDQVKRIDTQIERIGEQLMRREESLKRQFARMEAAMARLQQQGSQLMMAMMGAAAPRK